MLYTERTHPLYCYIFVALRVGESGVVARGFEFIHPHGPEPASFLRHQKTTDFSELFNIIRLDQGSGPLSPCLSTCNAVLPCVKILKILRGAFVWDLLRSCGAQGRALSLLRGFIIHTSSGEKKKQQH